MALIRKLLPLVAIVGTMMVAPGALRFDGDCNYQCSVSQNHSLLDDHGHGCGHMIRDSGGFCNTAGPSRQALGVNVERARRQDHELYQRLPSLRSYGLY